MSGYSQQEGDGMKGTIKLSPAQVGWLKMLKPGDQYKHYLTLRKKIGSVANMPDPLDRGNFFSFVRGETSRDLRDADVVFEAYGTSSEQMKVINAMGLQFGLDDNSSATDTDSKLDNFLKKCGDVLWCHGTKALSKLQVALARDRIGDRDHDSGKGNRPLENALLGLVDSILLNKSFRNNVNANVDDKTHGAEGLKPTDNSPFTNAQKRVLFGELLDYLIENRDYDRWSRWMVALSRESFRKAFSMIRIKGKSYDWFKEYAFDVSDRNYLLRLSFQKFEELAFFIRQLNMRINEVRHRNFVDEQKRFDKVAKAKVDNNNGALSLIFKELKDTTLERKVVVRNSFKWVLENVRPCWRALSVITNPNRWYFLMCATRLMYDWARWNYYSVRDEDKRLSCDMYLDILRLSDICAKEKSVDTEIICRFKYMASTACRYMAEGSSADIWGKKDLDEARRYVNRSVELAGDALRTWDKFADGNVGGKYVALGYRFARHYARQATFAARWWLQHPQKNGLRLLMPDKGDILCRDQIVENRNMYGIDMMKEAYKYCSKSICASIRPDEKLQGTIRLQDKRGLEYEFHLRVWIEMLVWNFDIDSKDDETRDVDYKAMVAFCQIVCIYCYLFAKTSMGKAFTSIRNDVMDEARKWLVERKSDASSNKYVVDMPFDVSVLDKTIQAAPPSIEETRFEIVASIIHSAATTKELLESTLWGALKNLAERVLNKKKNSHEVVTPDMIEFVNQIWLPARKGLEADIKQSKDKVASKTMKFNLAHTTKDELAKDWKSYPPFGFRNALVNAPGNNPRHVECVMRGYDLYIEKIKEEWESAQ